MRANETRADLLRRARRNPQEPLDRVAATVVTGVRVLLFLSLMAITALACVRYGAGER